MAIRALITGASGFIGSHLVGRLSRSGWEVSASVHRKAPTPAGSTVEWFQGDICNPDGFRGRLADVDYVFHVAGAIRGRKKQDFDEVNHGGTSRLLDAVEGECRSLRRFVYVSSLAAGGPNPGKDALDESDPARPIDMYGRSKLAAEEECLARRSRVPITIVRPPLVFGPGDTSSYQLFRLVRNHLRVVLWGPERLYSWIYIDDLVVGLIRAAMTPISSGEVLYLTAPSVVGWGELQSCIAEALGIRTLRVTIPYGALLAYGALAEIIGALSGVAPLVYRDKARQARPLAWTCSGGKAERLLDFRTDIALDAAVATSAAWYARAGWL